MTFVRVANDEYAIKNRLRYKGDGPVGYRVGRHVRYRREAVEAWLEQQADQRRHRLKKRRPRAEPLGMWPTVEDPP